MIQGDDIAINMTNLLLPRIGNPTSQVLDGLHPGITGQDQFDCPGVIGVNIEGELLIAGKAFCVSILKALEISVQAASTIFPILPQLK